jgi:predicted PurR-regulated permease PerM
MKNDIWAINQIFIFTATSLITLFLLKASSEIIVPFLISMAIAIVLSPLFTYIESKRIPKSISLIVVIFFALVPIIIFGGYIAEEARDFAVHYHTIKANFLESIHKFIIYMDSFGITIEEDKIRAILQKSNLSEILKRLATQANNQFSNIFLIFFMVAFMLMESKYFYYKMIKIATDYNIQKGIFIEILDKIKSYFIIKVKTSLITALWVLVVLWYYEVSYYYMLALLAFLLNFIPVIGSILAAIPAIILAFLDHNMVITVWVGLWYLIINIIIGNILEPHIMGRGLGLSALIIFLSMIFWGWIFGPTGMILSVPLTMIMQYLFAQYKETRWIALLLSDYKGSGTK